LLTKVANDPDMAADPRARFEALVRQYGRLISSVVRRVAGRAGDLVGQDVEQKVLVALWRQIEGEQTIDHPTSYIYRIAVREAVRMMRQETSRGQEPLEETARDTRADPFETVAREEQRRNIEAGLAALGADRQRAVRAHLSGFEVQEIMRMYGWPYQKARNLIARGMADLREALRRRGIDG
jgi:RNA polymerase sigma factor (sigma-70 family)